MIPPARTSQSRATPLADTSTKVLGGIADTVAQTLTATRMKQARRDSVGNRQDGAKDDFFNVEIHELEDKVPWPEDNLSHAAMKKLPPPFDFERMVRFMAYPCIMAPVQLRWFAFLSNTFPLGGGKSTVNAMKRVAFDQLLFAPVGMSWICLSWQSCQRRKLTSLQVLLAFSHS